MVHSLKEKEHASPEQIGALSVIPVIAIALATVPPTGTAAGEASTSTGTDPATKLIKAVHR